MDIALVLAQVYGIMFLVIGISVFQRSFMNDVVAGLANNAAMLWFAGFIAFLMGLVSLELYSSWASDWTVAITIIGWLALIKGLALLLMPRSVISAYQSLTSGNAVKVSGTLALVIGAWLCYVGFLM